MGVPLLEDVLRSMEKVIKAKEGSFGSVISCVEVNFYIFVLHTICHSVYDMCSNYVQTSFYEEVKTILLLKISQSELVLLLSIT